MTHALLRPGMRLRDNAIIVQCQNECSEYSANNKLRHSTAAVRFTVTPLRSLRLPLGEPSQQPVWFQLQFGRSARARVGVHLELILGLQQAQGWDRWSDDVAATRMASQINSCSWQKCRNTEGSSCGGKWFALPWPCDLLHQPCYLRARLGRSRKLWSNLCTT